MHDLTDFWHRLEGNFPLGGPRRHLGEQLGTELVSALEKIDILRLQHVADRYPCPRPGGDGCPRVIIELEDGRIEAICGNESSECPDLALKPRDIEVLGVAPEKLCEVMAKALQIRGQVETLQSVRHVYRVGTFIPEPGVRHAIYLAVRCSERDYDECLDALRSHAEQQFFAVLVPTERFVTEAVHRRMATIGAPVLPLVDTVGLGADGQLKALVLPVKFFEGIGRPGVRGANASPTLVAEVLVRGCGSTPTWRPLDDAGYRALVEAQAEYHIFADELSKSVTKGQGTKRRTTSPVRASYFQMIRAALKKKTNFDPSVDGSPDDGFSGKQTFQRARQVFDLGSAKTWALFKTDRTDNHAVYRFDPDPSVSFAFIFAPAEP